jgi:hypothetical protein
VIDWAARAKAQLALPTQASTVKTDETPLLSVLSVPPAAVSAERNGVSSVSSAGHPCVVVAAIDGAIHAAPVIAAMPANVDRASGNPHMTPEQGDDCHACGWDDAEIALFMGRAARFAQIGRRDAEHLAERLTLRDRQFDDRRMCVECRELEPSGRCAAARRGAIPGADRRMEPVQTLLCRCPGFRCAVSAHECKQGNDHANVDD